MINPDVQEVLVQNAQKSDLNKSCLVRHAERELALMEDQDDPMQQMMNADILKLIGIFAEQGHSGFSAKYLIRIIERLMRLLPIAPLTGEDAEWNQAYEGVDQNNRCSAVFRDNHDNATAHYIYGKVFSDDEGRSWFTNKHSHVHVDFPYTPPLEPEHVILNAEQQEVVDAPNI